MKLARTKSDLLAELEAAQQRILELELSLNAYESRSEPDEQGNSKLARVLDLLPVGISILDENRKVVFQNSALSTILDLSAEELNSGSYKNRRYLMADGMPMPSDGFASVQAVQKGEAVHNVETGIVKENGETIWTNVSAMPINMPGWKTLIVTADITERKRAEEAIERTRNTLAEAQKIAHLGSFEYIAATQTTVWSEEEYRIYGLDPAGTSPEYNTMLQNCIHPDDAALLHETFTKAMQSNSVYELEHRVVRPDGSVRWVYDRAMPYLNERGEIIRYVGITLDITERKLMEDELRRSNAELEQFAYVASHDLQEPLRAMAGMVQLLQQRYKGKLDERADEYINHAVEASTRMQALINDLLTYSRVDRRGKPFELISLQKCVEAALKNLEVAVRESHARVTWGSLPTVRAESGQLVQVFQNLVGNAIKFRGGREPQIHIEGKRLEDAWQISVCDNGIGIEAQYFERIFQVFQRLHTRVEYPGTGIGLALCKKIIERHSGTIWVESQPGEGSTFHFTIPIRRKSDETQLQS